MGSRRPIGSASTHTGALLLLNVTPQETARETSVITKFALSTDATIFLRVTLQKTAGKKTLL